MQTDLEGIEITLIECFRKLREGAKRMEHAVDEERVTAYKMGDIIRIDIKLAAKEDIPF